MANSNDLSLMLNMIGSQVGIEKDRYWQWGSSPLPRDQYHRVVFYVYGDYSPAMLAAMPATFEEKAKLAGFRLLKVERIGEDNLLGSMPGILFSGYGASDVYDKTVGDLSKALMGAPTVIDSEPVGLAERAALDALWISKGAKLPKVEHEIDVRFGIAAGVAAILAVGLILWMTVSRIK